jgi:transcriptional regulator with XRE-family HTH domain
VNTHAEGKPGTENPLPERAVTANQVVAWNLARYRRAAGWTQGQLGAAIGWTEDKVSDAERSWHSGRTREFDAQALTVIAVALGIPVVGLLLPPGSDGHEEVLEILLPGGRVLDMAGYMAEAVMPDSDSETFAADAYRARYAAAAEQYLDSGWAETGKRWAGVARTPQAAVDRAAWVRDKQREVAELAAGLADFADGIEKGKGE